MGPAREGSTIGPTEPANGGRGSGGEIGGSSGRGGGRFEKGWARGPMGERGAASIIRRGRCSARGPLGAPDGDVDLGGGI